MRYSERIARLEALEADYGQRNDEDAPRIAEYWRRWVADHTWTPADHATRVDVLLDALRAYGDTFYWNRTYYGPNPRPRPSGPGAVNAQRILQRLQGSCGDPRKADAALAGIRKLLDKLQAADDPRAAEFAAFVDWSADIVTKRLEMNPVSWRFTPCGRQVV